MDILDRRDSIFRVLLFGVEVAKVGFGKLMGQMDDRGGCLAEEEGERRYEVGISMVRSRYENIAWKISRALVEIRLSILNC